MAETAIAAVLSKFWPLALSEAKLLAQVGDDMMLLRDRLEWLQAFIRDADRKRRAGTDGLTQVWVRQTRDVAFQVEDALDDFFYQVDLESQGYHGWKKWRKYLTGCSTQIVMRHGLSSQLKKIKVRLEQISENQKEYKIEYTPFATLTTSTTAIAAWRDDYENDMGFDDDVKTLEGMLLHKDYPERMFISIFGESGIGKKGLVKKMYHDMKNNFDVVVWYDMVPDSSMEFFLGKVERKLEYQHAQQQDEVIKGMEEGIDIANKLHHRLSSKKYMVILGSISSKTMLNCVKASLPDDKNGSRVVLVLDTESEEVAWHANTMNRKGINWIHHLSRLDEERSGRLFRSGVFRKEVYDEKENMSKYDNIVYHVTGGYPLAIGILAGLLRFKEKSGQWDAVLQQLMPGPKLEEAQGVASKNLSTRTTIERIFSASFEDLPTDLKSCFLYFATLKQNSTHTADVIVRRWIAEGFIKPQKGKTMEELGHGYLKELVLRCLVWIKSMTVTGDIKKVMVHTSLEGFLQSEVREAGFVDFCGTYHTFVPPSVRRLCYQSLDGTNMASTNKFPKLRTFICRVKGDNDTNKKHWHDLKFLRGSKYLRVIHIRGLRLNELPEEIGDMIHLRYIQIVCKDLQKLPASIKRLLNLQTLDIRGTQVDMIDPSFWKIKVLRHVLADNLMLPTSIEEELDELQTLHGVKPATQGEWDQLNCPLHKMTRLRSLELHGFKRDKHKAGLESALPKMHLLGHLKLRGDVIPSCLFTAHNLRYLGTVQLDGTVEWPQVPLNFGMLRPNLIQLRLKKNNNEVPLQIREEIKELLIEE